MVAEILSIGTELLLGMVANTDAQFISRELAARGIFVRHHTVVGDNAERVTDAVGTARGRADIIITTGGLGPTYDDMTKQTVCGCFGRKLVMHGPSLEQIHAYFERIGRACTPNNEQQAMLPEGCQVLENGAGTAPGCAFEQDGVHVIMLPGPPRECMAMLNGAARPYLDRLSENALASRYIRFFGIGESELEQRLRPLMERSLNPTVAPYASEGEVCLRVTASAPTSEACEKLLKPVTDDIQAQFPEYIYGVDVDNLEQAVSARLKERGETLAVAESCTGGLIARRMTALPGASDVFWGGVTAYSEEAKIKLLGVPKQILEQYGAVSEQTARAMAGGILGKSGCGRALAVTGLCGPDDADGVPAGTVYIAFAAQNAETSVKKIDVRGRGRTYAQTLAAGHALKGLLDSMR